MSRKPLAPHFFAICIFCIMFFLCACHKTDKPAADNQDFYISFTTAGTDIKYEVGSNFQYLRGGTQSTQYITEGIQFGIYPATYLSPLPTNVNIYTAGFSFGYDTLITSYTLPNAIPYTNIGNTLFTTGEHSICYTGMNHAFDGLMSALSCANAKGISFFWTKDGVMLNSAAVRQPLGSFCRIDTVLNHHHDDPLNLKIYDKIISGSFQCRVYNPADFSQYYDLTNGKFRMPVWRNKAD